MPIKLSYPNQSDIPTEYAALYTERSGKWYLTEVEGIKTSDDVARVSTALEHEKKSHSETKKKWEAVTSLGHGPDEVVKLLDEHGDMKIKIDAGAGEKFDQEKFDKAVQSRVDTHQVRWERERKQLLEKVALGETTISGLTGKINTSKIESEVRKACMTIGVKPDAISDALLLSERVMEITDTGEIQVRDKVGYTPGLNIQEFLEDRKADRTHWFEESKGGGSKTKNGVPVGVNPWKAESRNLGQQGEIYKKDKVLAQRLADEAGVKLGI